MEGRNRDGPAEGRRGRESGAEGAAGALGDLRAAVRRVDLDELVAASGRLPAGDARFEQLTDHVGAMCEFLEILDKETAETAETTETRETTETTETGETAEPGAADETEGEAGDETEGEAPTETAGEAAKAEALREVRESTRELVAAAQARAREATIEAARLQLDEEARRDAKRPPLTEADLRREEWGERVYELLKRDIVSETKDSTPHVSAFEIEQHEIEEPTRCFVPEIFEEGSVRGSGLDWLVCARRRTCPRPCPPGFHGVAFSDSQIKFDIEQHIGAAETDLRPLAELLAEFVGEIAGDLDELLERGCRLTEARRKDLWDSLSDWGQYPFTLARGLEAQLERVRLERARGVTPRRVRRDPPEPEGEGEGEAEGDGDVDDYAPDPSGLPERLRVLPEPKDELRALDALADGPYSASEIGAATGLAEPRVAQLFAELAEGGALVRRVRVEGAPERYVLTDLGRALFVRTAGAAPDARAPAEAETAAGDADAGDAGE